MDEDLLRTLISVFQQRALRAMAMVPSRGTSYLRTIGHNAEVGGVADSQHLIGLALDLVPLSGATTSQLAAAIQRSGLVAIDEGDHVHAQLIPVTAKTKPIINALVTQFAVA